MLKICAAALFATLLCAGAACAHGSGGAEPMPGTNFTDMPSYWPQPFAPAERLKPRHVRWRRGAARDR